MPEDWSDRPVDFMRERRLQPYPMAGTTPPALPPTPMPPSYPIMMPYYTYPYYGGYYPISPYPVAGPPMAAPGAAPPEKPKKKKGPLEQLKDAIKMFWKKETTEPMHLKVAGFFMLGLLGALFMPFYPWWMCILIGLIVCLPAYRFPHVSLVLLVLFVTAAIAYQGGVKQMETATGTSQLSYYEGGELGFIFLVVSIIVLCVSLFDWKFGYFVFLTLFFAKFGLPFIIPIFGAMFYSVFFGLVVSVTAGIFLTIFVTFGNFKVLGFFVGPAHTESLMYVIQTTPGTTVSRDGLNPVVNDFTLSHFGAAFSSLSKLHLEVFDAGLRNFGNALVPIAQIIVWTFATYLIVLVLEERSKLSIRKIVFHSVFGGGLITLSSLLAMAYFRHISEPGAIFLALTIFVAILITVLLGLIIMDAFSAYFAGRLGVTTVGTRIAEMAALHKTTFDMVGGLTDVKADIKESMIIPLLRKDVSEQFGIEPPKGLLLFGPPGCGKTLLMKALATELNVEMISVKCSDLMSKWYGESEARVAELFKTAKSRKPCILFMDEVDAIAKRRDLYSADDVSPRLLSIILAELDGMDKAAGIIVVGTTNKPEMIDPALLRPGRFDKIIYVPPPDYDERIDIFKVHLMGKPVAPDINLTELAKRTERFSGADIANLVKEAATVAMKRMMQTGQPSMIYMQDFLDVLSHVKPSITLRMKEDYEKMKMDYERKMHVLARSERKVVVKWDDVGGLEDIKRALKEYVELPLTKAELMEEYKLKTGRGLLLFGPPGCGKTHIMRAASNELSVAIQIVNGPELVSALAGASEAAIRDVMSRARENAPSILFFDEIDALASKESMKTPEVNRAVSQFLTEMDGLRPKDKVIIVATTNRPHLLDPALLRPGRFDKIFYVPPPDLQARNDIFRIHLKGVPTAGYIDTMLLAHRTEGFSGADIAAIVDEAKLIAIRKRIETAGAAAGASELAQHLEKMVKGAGEEAKFGVKMDHLLEALSKAKSSITPETLEWAKTFMEIYGVRT